MENYIVIKGKTVELTDEQIQKMIASGIVKENTNPFERVHTREIYYYINQFGKIYGCMEEYCPHNDGHFEVGNYCTDKEVLRQQALRETLNRLLWRYSMEHDGDKVKWANDTMQWYIYYDCYSRVFTVSFNIAINVFSTVYFISKETALNAIREVVEPFMAEHPDFIW